MAAVPSGLATTVRAPFRTTNTPRSRANLAAVLIRSALTLCGVASVSSRAISPGWGVRIGGVLHAVSIDARPASAFSASASRTAGRSSCLVSACTNSTVSGWVDSPGPIAIAVLAAIKAVSRSSAVREKVRDLVSGIGMVMASSSFASNTSLTLEGTATVTSPAPIRRAARAARAAAPVLPTEPAMIPAWPNVPLWLDGLRVGQEVRTNVGVINIVWLVTASM